MMLRLLNRADRCPALEWIDCIYTFGIAAAIRAGQLFNERW